jgi:Spy/CpxP family protein refolding chaperone
VSGSLNGFAGLEARTMFNDGKLGTWKDWKMKRISFILALAVIGSLALGSAEAMARGHRHGHMGGDGPCMGFGLIRVLERMDLSEDQEQQIASVFKSHRDEIAKEAAAAAEAGSSLKKAMHDPESSEESVQEVARTMAAQHERMILLKSKIMKEVRSVLTPDQNERIRRFAEKRSGLFQGAVDSRLAAMDRWIAEHSK